MKKLFFSLVVLASLAFLWFKADFPSMKKVEDVAGDKDQKSEILRFAIVADSHGDNENLKMALDLAKSWSANFVVGLGDYTEVGTRGQLNGAKKVFDKSGLKYYLTPGDHDLWDSRNRGEEALYNYRDVFGEPSQVFEKAGVEFLIVDNSDIYKGISDSDWQLVNENLSRTATPQLIFVFSHKTPYHPQSAHIMGEETQSVAAQAKEYLKLLEGSKVDGFFSGDLHFFAEFSSYASDGGFGGSTSGGKSNDGVKISTIGAVGSERNFQGPRFAVVKVYSDYSWEVEDVEIR
ncbi:MAG: metallophosphoesterase [Patescibacteria group bacterium]